MWWRIARLKNYFIRIYCLNLNTFIRVDVSLLYIHIYIIIVYLKVYQIKKTNSSPIRAEIKYFRFDKIMIFPIKTIE